MADILEGTVMEVKFVYKASGQTLMNVIHYKTKARYNNLDPTLVATSFLTIMSNNGAGDWVTIMSNAQASNVAWQRVTAQLIYPTRYILHEQVVNVIGFKPISCTAQNVQASVEKFGELGNRHSVGNFHLGGLSQNDYTNGLLSPGLKAQMDIIAAKFEASIVDAGSGVEWFPAILNKVKVPNTDPVKYQVSGATEIFGAEAADTLRVMNRRTVGRGI